MISHSFEIVLYVFYATETEYEKVGKTFVYDFLKEDFWHDIRLSNKHLPLIMNIDHDIEELYVIQWNLRQS